MQAVLVTQVSGNIRALGMEHRRSERADAAPSRKGREAVLTPSSFDDPRNKPFSSGSLPLVQDPFCWDFPKQRGVKSSIWEKEKCSDFRASWLSSPETTSDSNDLGKKKTVQGPAQLTLCQVDMHFLQLHGEDFSLRPHPWGICCSCVAENYPDVYEVI